MALLLYCRVFLLLFLTAQLKSDDFNQRLETLENLVNALILEKRQFLNLIDSLHSELSLQRSQEQCESPMLLNFIDDISKFKSKAKEHINAQGREIKKHQSAIADFQAHFQRMMPCQYDKTGYATVRGKCLYFENRKLAYFEAKANCADKFYRGGKLIEPKSLVENNAIYNRVKPRTGTAWIGITDTYQEGKFVYGSTGGQIEFDHWLSGNPSKVPDNSEDCVYFGYAESSQWTDVECNLRFASVCEEN